MVDSSAPIIESLSAAEAERHLEALGALLHACVHDGASIGFILPFSTAEAEAFWRDRVFPSLRAGGRILLVAWVDGRPAGTVQLVTETPANQPHRAEASKLLVHPAFRRQGIARALMVALESQARQSGRALITLDTRTGDKAEPLYASLGFVTAGIIPGYCRDPFVDQLDATTVMYKTLTPPAGRVEAAAG
ncbi:GNAT family N-acetyltransferase [Nitratireductor sp. ZSWI3]|uniref:GNAT family N-acetyltransferase n=1 Tax=Nitratireductor sp. ZSWI3 TaxID=2966359 RepID=UPI00214FEF82|nr:GNAT family N-acetyltransferase [Nitratireductor sp. ZSWI3]MCR4269120.1 GNAT family N-acetyltransferase [Nitratireductor sp. ZSWI3]